MFVGMFFVCFGGTCLFWGPLSPCSPLHRVGSGGLCSDHVGRAFWNRAAPAALLVWLLLMVPGIFFFSSVHGA